MTVFLFVFAGGVFADLLETKGRVFVTAGIGGLLVASGVWNFVQLWRLR